MLEKLFTSKNRIKILEYLFFVNEESYIREISRELKMPVSAVKREIDNLLSIGIITINKNRIVLNKKCNFIDELRNIFVKTDAIFYPIKQVLDDRRIFYCLTFGSFANGTYTHESDVDLLIIGNIKLFDLTKLLKPVEIKIKREINPVVWTIDNFKKERKSSFVKDIFNKKIIMLRGDENELRRITK